MDSGVIDVDNSINILTLMADSTYETSETFYEELESALAFVPNYRRVYVALNAVFKRAITDKTRHTSINFSGTFAKTDYLLKEYGAGKQIVRNTNDTRGRLRQSHELDEQELEQMYLQDLRSICEFIHLLYKTPIPTSLKERFPRERIRKPHHRLVSEYTRVIVDSCDENFILCRAEDDPEGKQMKVSLHYDHSDPHAYPFDWDYLISYLHEGTQLNIIRPRMKESIVYPELIIFEPDYLVNISSVAKCFTSYADSPFVNLVNKLEAYDISEPILLGNLAGQLLDEAIHQQPGSRSYSASVMDFYKNNALNLLTTDISDHFHTDAQYQQQNIQNTINTFLPQALGSFNPKEGIVEPSFFSEMLGLQGRMDYLQLDYKVLMEQKSGKGAFPYKDFVNPESTQEHYVQLMLYMMLIRYNHREKYEQNKEELQAFLLYTKYKNTLLRKGFAPSLLFDSIKMRNGIAWSEFNYTQPDGYRILETLTPERLNQKRCNGNFWNNWIRPRLATFLAPLQTASELEKDYYFRFLRFISLEHLLSKIGNKTKDDSGFASTWHNTLEEKKNAGNIYDNLILISPSNDTIGKIETVTLGFHETVDNDMSNFRIGDIVILYPYDPEKEPDARKTMVLRCSIQDLKTDRICLRLRNPQADNRIFRHQEGKKWAIEHDFMEASYSSLYRGMHAFLSAPKLRRDLLLMQREPQTDESLQLKGDYGDFNKLALRVKRAQDIFLIIGPPGTGKTSFGLMNTVLEELREPDSNILLLSYTNRAVDEICSKLEGAGLDFIRLGNELNCAEEHRDKMLCKRVEGSSKSIEIKTLIHNTRIFVGTTNAFNSNLHLFKIKQFSLAVIDEASQILEPQLIGLLSVHNDGVPAIRKFVMIGDHKQLPAVVKQDATESKVSEPALNDILLTDCRLSLFERLLKRYRNNPNVTYMLRRQGRMHPKIALFSNNAFYNKLLTEVPRPHQRIELPSNGDGTNGIDDLLKTRRVAFLASEPTGNSTSDKVNQNEADMIAATVVRIYELNKDVFDENETVGVIVPYRNQIATVRNTIDRYGIPCLHNITIDTVERYQGSQRKHIIYGFTVSKYYQLDFLTSNVFVDTDGTIIDRKLNVAMTRAEEHLIMIGNPRVLAYSSTFTELIEFTKRHHCYFEIKKDDYVAGRFDLEIERVVGRM